MSSPDKKRKTTATAKKPSLKNNKKKTPALVLPPAPQSSPSPSLPDDLLLSCLARVSRLYYPTLSFVSKSFSSLLVSPELYKTRSSLGRTESCLYVCLRFLESPEFRWFTLCRRPNRPLTTSDAKKKKPSGFVLAKIPIPPQSGPVGGWECLVTVDSNIYIFGGPLDDDNDSSSRFLILDSRSNTWREGPSMLVKRRRLVASVLDGKIYVAGGRYDWSSPFALMEVFDPKTQTWEFVSNPGGEIYDFNNFHKSAGVDGKVYIFGNFRNCDLAYEPREGRWERVRGVDWHLYSYSVVDNVLYRYDDGCFKWYDTKVALWRILKGLKGLPKIPRYSAKLLDYGGKMAVLWERVVAHEEKLILCAVIALERRNHEEIWGTVEWYDTVLTALPESCLVECAVATTV